MRSTPGWRYSREAMGQASPAKAAPVVGMVELPALTGGLPAAIAVLCRLPCGFLDLNPSVGNAVQNSMPKAAMTNFKQERCTQSSSGNEQREGKGVRMGGDGYGYRTTGGGGDLKAMLVLRQARLARRPVSALGPPPPT